MEETALDAKIVGDKVEVHPVEPIAVKTGNTCQAIGTISHFTRKVIHCHRISGKINLRLHVGDRVVDGL